jgi:uncharacterized protein YuzE
VAEGIMVEFDEGNQPIGIEIFNAMNAMEVIASTIGREPLAANVA